MPREPEEVLAGELAHYRARWSESDALVNQRLTMLISILAGAVAATAALLSHKPTATGPSNTTLIAGIWLVLAMVSEAIFLRIVRARLSICRSIMIINLLRAAMIKGFSATPAGEALSRAYVVDDNPPEPFAILASPEAPAVVNAASLFMAIWFSFGHGEGSPPLWAYAAMVVCFIGNNVVYWKRAHGWREAARATPNETREEWTDGENQLRKSNPDAPPGPKDLSG
jgi:hypothetical protein